MDVLMNKMSTLKKQIKIKRSTHCQESIESETPEGGLIFHWETRLQRKIDFIDETCSRLKKIEQTQLSLQEKLKINNLQIETLQAEKNKDSKQIKTLADLRDTTFNMLKGMNESLNVDKKDLIDLKSKSVGNEDKYDLLMAVLEDVKIQLEAKDLQIINLNEKIHEQNFEIEQLQFSMNVLKQTYEETMECKNTITKQELIVQNLVQRVEKNLVQLNSNNETMRQEFEENLKRFKSDIEKNSETIIQNKMEFLNRELDSDDNVQCIAVILKKLIDMFINAGLIVEDLSDKLTSCMDQTQTSKTEIISIKENSSHNAEQIQNLKLCLSEIKNEFSQTNMKHEKIMNQNNEKLKESFELCESNIKMANSEIDKLKQKQKEQIEKTSQCDKETKIKFVGISVFRDIISQQVLEIENKLPEIEENRNEIKLINETVKQKTKDIQDLRMNVHEVKINSDHIANDLVENNKLKTIENQKKCEANAQLTNDIKSSLEKQIEKIDEFKTFINEIQKNTIKIEFLNDSLVKDVPNLNKSMLEKSSEISEIKKNMAQASKKTEKLKFCVHHMIRNYSDLLKVENINKLETLILDRAIPVFEGKIIAREKALITRIYDNFDKIVDILSSKMKDDYNQVNSKMKEIDINVKSIMNKNIKTN